MLLEIGFPSASSSVFLSNYSKPLQVLCSTLCLISPVLMNKLASWVTAEADVPELSLLSSYPVTLSPILITCPLHSPFCLKPSLSTHVCDPLPLPHFTSSSLAPSSLLITHSSFSQAKSTSSFDSQIQPSFFPSYSSFSKQLSLLPTSQSLLSSILLSLP